LVAAIGAVQYEMPWKVTFSGRTPKELAQVYPVSFAERIGVAHPP
jgi:hypothetical protein